MVWIPNNHLPWKSQTKPTPDSDLCGYQAALISFVVDSALGCPRLSLTRQFWKACSRLGLVQSLPLAAQRSHWRSVLNWPWACTKIFGQFARNSSRIGECYKGESRGKSWRDQSQVQNNGSTFKWEVTVTHAKELQQYVSNMWQNDPCHVPHLRPLPPPLKHSSKCLADTIFVQVQFISRLFEHSEDLCIQSNLTWRRVQKHDEFLKSLFTFFLDIDLVTIKTQRCNFCEVPLPMDNSEEGGSENCVHAFGSRERRHNKG